MNAADGCFGECDRRRHEQNEPEESDEAEHGRAFVEVQYVEHGEEELIAGAHEEQNRL